MKKTYVLSVILLFTLSTVICQPAFKVLASKGKNEIKVGGAWQPIKVGAAIGKKDEIKVAPNSYLGLVHVGSGKPFELKEAGSYPVVELEKKVPAGTSVMSKYTDFILSSSTQPNSNLNATGAVHRGFDEINVYLPTVPQLNAVYGSDLIISWNPEEKGPFVVTLMNNFDDELKKVETSEHSIAVDLKDKVFSADNFIKIKVESKGSGKKSSEKVGVRIISKSEKEKIKKTIDTEVPGLQNEQTALAKLTMAAFFENQKLLVDAAAAYQQAIKLAPDVPMYNEAYQAFLVRTSLKEMTEKK